MKNIIYFLLLISTFSCSRETKNKSSATSKQDNIVEKIEDENSSRFSSGRSYNNIVDGIYSEMIKNDSTLKKFDEEYNASYKQSQKALDEQDEILRKPKQYFLYVSENISHLKDSAKKNELKNFIKNNSEIFKQRDLKLREKYLEINSNQNSINDAYFAFKVKKTLPEMIKYLKQNPGNLENINKEILEQKKFLEKIKSLK